MFRLISRRLLRLIPVLILVTLLATFLIDLAPGDPAIEIVGQGATPELIAEVTAKYGLADPLPVRYGRWVSGLVSGDLGVSYRTNQPVSDAIRDRLPVTAELGLLALLLAAIVAIPLAMATATHPGGRLDRYTAAGTSVVLSMAGFVIALVLALVFGVWLRLLPITGWITFADDPIGHFRALALPVITLAIPEIVVLQRVLRADLIATLHQDFITVARAKGLSTRAILIGHAMRPSSFSVLTLAGLSLGRILGGSVIVESVFALPGLGRLLVTAILGKDVLMVQGALMVVALIVLGVNLLVDVLYAALDPRVRA